jgi:hypothetical protein
MEARRRRAAETATKRPRRSVAPRPLPQGYVAGARILAAILLVVAWFMGQWAYSRQAYPGSESRRETRVLFSLSRVEALAGVHPNYLTLASRDLASIEGEKASTTRTVAAIVTALLALTVLGCLAGILEMILERRIPFLGISTLIASFLLVVAGWIYTTSGIVAEYRSWLSVATGMSLGESSATPAASYWMAVVAFLVVLASFLLARASARAIAASPREEA